MSVPAEDPERAMAEPATDEADTEQTVSGAVEEYTEYTEYVDLGGGAPSEPGEPEPGEPSEAGEPFEPSEARTANPETPEAGEPEEVAEPLAPVPPLPERYARLGAEGLARVRARYADLAARLAAKELDDSQRAELTARAERLNPDAWLTTDEVAAALEEYEALFESLRAVVGRQPRSRRL